MTDAAAPTCAECGARLAAGADACDLCGTPVAAEPESRPGVHLCQDAWYVSAQAPRKLRFEGELRPLGKRDWVLVAQLGAVDPEKGWQWDAVVSADNTDLETVTKSRLGLDFGFALPIGHSSVWFYNAAGTTDGARSNPLGNYYFGGFGNNYVDDGAVKRYREYDSFPGFEIDEIIASEFVKSVVELNLPPIRFREVGTPSFFLSHIRPAAFVGTLITDPGKTFERDFASAGMQFDLSFTIAHHLPMTLSLGYAVGFESGDRLGDEWMLSLKIL